MGQCDRFAGKRSQAKVRSLMMRHETRPMKEVIQRVMPVVRGWINYFWLAGRSPVLYHLGKVVVGPPEGVWDEVPVGTRVGQESPHIHTM